MPTVAILHGTGGSPSGNWFPWIDQQLTDKGVKVYRPALPTPEGQSLTAWRAAFSMQVPEYSNDTILVGHSLGSTFLLRLLEEALMPIRGSVLVAGLVAPIGIETYDALNSTFTAESFD